MVFGTIADLIAAGKEFGIFQFYLPFIISYAILYGILSKAKLFGEKKTGRNINIVISAVLSLFLIGATPVGTMLAEYFGSLFTGTILVVVTLIGTMMILYTLGALVGIDITTVKAKKWAALLILIAIILAIGVFASSGGKAFFPGLVFPGVTIPEIPVPIIPEIGLTTTDIAIILLVLGTIGIIWWMQETTGEKEK